MREADLINDEEYAAKKKEILDTILDNPEEAKMIYPAAHVKPREKLLWFVTEKG